MNPLVLGPLFELGKGIIERMFPDPQKKAEAELELMKLAQSGDLQVILAQLQINAKEAESPSLLVAGWRPFTGWISAFGLLYATVLHNVLGWVAIIQKWPSPPPVDTETLLYVLFALLGVAGLRSYDKKQGTAAK